MDRLNHRYEKIWIKFVAISLFFLGIMNIFSAWLSFNPPRLHLLRQVMDYEIIIGSRYLAIITGLAALIVSPALFRQKKLAWYLSVFILGISGFSHVLKGADIEEAAVCLILFGILLPLYKYCRVKSDPVRVFHGWGIFIASLLFVALYTIIGINIFQDRLGVDVSAHSIWSIILDALMLDTTKLRPVGLRAGFYVDSIFLINSIAYITGLIFLLSPVIARRLPDVNREKLKNIIYKCASQPVQQFTLTNDYQHFLYKTKQCEGVISYKLSHRVAMAIGNPCIECSNIEEITKKWLEMAYEHDWIPAIYQAQGELVEFMKNKKFNVVPIGVEAVVRLETFTLEGKHMQNLRTGRNKGIKEGWEIRKFEKKDWHKVKELDSKWLSLHGNHENSFAMGKSSFEYLERTKTSLLFDKDNNLLAYLNNIELPLSSTRSVDLMRRSPDSPKGTMEYLFLNEILEAKDDDLQFYDLGFSPLAKIDEAFSDNTVLTKLFKLIYEKQKKYYDFQGLHAFKSKFNPEWNQSYLVYTNTVELPAVLMALLDLNKGK